MRRAKLSHTDQLRANDAAMLRLSALTGKPVPDELLNNVRARLPKKKTVPQILKRNEADVQRDIISLLKQHPKVAMIDRINSGAMKTGTGRYVKFNRTSVRGALSPDIHATLKGGGKRFVIEVKAPGWKAPDWAILAKADGLLSEKLLREIGQKCYLDAVNKAGGIGIFAASVDDVLDALETV